MGWARANIIFDKAPKPPAPGSPMEIMFVLVWHMRQNIEFHKSRSLMQALLSQKDAEEKSISEAFDHLKEAFFPFDRNEKKAQIKDLRHHMLKEISRGALQVTPMEDTAGRKKVANRLVQGQGVQAHRQAMANAGALAAMDPYDQARKRKRGA